MISPEDKETLSAFCELFRGDEEKRVQHTTSLIVDNKPAQKLVSAWSILPVVWSPPRVEPPVQSLGELWFWLWRGRTIDYELWYASAGINELIGDREYEPLINQRILYPDGTISEAAAAYLRSMVLDGSKRSQRKKYG